MQYICSNLQSSLYSGFACSLRVLRVFYNARIYFDFMNVLDSRITVEVLITERCVWCTTTGTVLHISYQLPPLVDQLSPRVSFAQYLYSGTDINSYAKHLFQFAVSKFLKEEIILGFFGVCFFMRVLCHASNYFTIVHFIKRAMQGAFLQNI